MTELDALQGKTLLITGAAGMLGRAFQDSLASLAPGARVLARAHADLDVTDRAAVLAQARERPDVILHCAADVDADRCEGEPERCRAVQVGGTENVIALARQTGATLLYPQSFLIFGEVPGEITEATEPAPMSVYGRCKLEAERAVLASLPGALVVRMAGFFGGEEADKNFVGKFARHITRLAAAGPATMDVGDRVWQPTYTVDLARNALVLVATARSGVYNMASHGSASFYELACETVSALGLAPRVTIKRTDAASMAGREKARRPLSAVMANGRLVSDGLDRQRPWRDALREYLARPYFSQLVQTQSEAR